MFSLQRDWFSLWVHRLQRDSAGTSSHSGPMEQQPPNYDVADGAFLWGHPSPRERRKSSDLYFVDLTSGYQCTFAESL